MQKGETHTMTQKQQEAKMLLKPQTAMLHHQPALTTVTKSSWLGKRCCPDSYFLSLLSLALLELVGTAASLSTVAASWPPAALAAFPQPAICM